MVTYGTLHVPLLVSHIHPTIVEHALYVIPEGRDILSHALSKDVNFMLQLCTLLA
jgi:hypothetical protein